MTRLVSRAFQWASRAMVIIALGREKPCPASGSMLVPKLSFARLSELKVGGFMGLLALAAEFV